MNTALSWMPERLSQRAAALIPMIVLLPRNTLDVYGASFELTNAVVVFEHPAGDDAEEQLTVLHEMSHILDPGWEHVALTWALKSELKKAPAVTRRMLRRVGSGPLEGFAELACWEMAGVRELRHLPLSAAIVHEALTWEAN